VSGINQTVAQVYVKTASMGLPAWVWQPSQRLEDHYASTGNTGLTNFPETDWKVNHLGTKAVAVCYTKVDAVKDDDYCPAIPAQHGELRRQQHGRRVPHRLRQR
jgi:hypothetical protein